MNLPEFSVKRRVTITMATILVVILGMVAFSGLGFEMMPELEFPVITISTRYPGASSEDIEQTITKPIETIAGGVKGVTNIISTSSGDVSSVMIEFEWGTDLDAAAQDLRDGIERILDFLPEGAERPLVMKLDITQMPIILYAVTGMEDTYEMRKLLEDELEPKLTQLPGVASVTVAGGKQAEKQIIIDKTKLTQNNISIDKVVQILATQNLNLSAGYVEQGQTEYLLRTVGEYKTLEEIANTPVSITQNGSVVYIKDVAKVIDGYKEERNYIRTNNEPTATLMVSKESGANTLEVSNLVKERVEELRADLPAHLEFYEIFDQGHTISRVTSSTIANLIQGAILAILIILLFLRNWRPTLAIAIAIPVSVIATFILVNVSGYTLNIMTIGGLALAVGMLVDSAIVVIENIYRHLERGKGRIEAAKIGASQVGMAITASVLTTIAVFLPLVFTGGMTGQLVEGIALTVSFALFASLIVALTVVPALSSVLFKQRTSAEEYKKVIGESRFEKLRERYAKVLNWTLHHKGRVLLIVAIIFIISLSLIPILGTEFIPPSDNPMQMIRVEMPIGTKLDETNMVVTQLEDILAGIEETEYFTTMVGPLGGAVGGAGFSAPADVNEAMIFLRLCDKENRSRKSDEIMEEVRSKAPKLENVRLVLSGATETYVGGGNEIEFKIFGDDLDQLTDLSRQVEEKIAQVEGVRDIQNSMKEGKPELHLIINKDKAFRYGITTAQIASAVRTTIYGTTAGVFREAGEEIDMLVRLEEEGRNSIADINGISIASPMGFTIPLNQIVEIQEKQGPVEISRENQTRIATIQANIIGRDVGTAVDDIWSEVGELEKSLPSGYYFEIGGTYEDMQESFEALGYALLLAIIIVYAIMASLFESFSHPFVIMFTLPLGLIGVVILLLISGFTFSVPVFIGFIILAGIVVNNGIVLVNHINQLRREGMEKEKAIIQAGKNRIRPVLMTALTSIGGMLPMALSTGQGSELKAPMGVAVIGGLISATFFTLFVVPSLYSVFDHVSKKASKGIMNTLHGEEKTKTEDD
ncbi:MAG: efflux RND transporter permease subunit [Candidatus Cloacimonadia bacterium]